LSEERQHKTLTLNGFLTRLIWLCALPLALLAIYLAVDHVQTLQAQRDKEADTLAKNAIVIIDSHLKAQISALQILAASSLVDDRTQWRAFYEQAMGFRKQFSGHIIFADLSKRMLFNTRTPYGSKLPELPEVKGHAAMTGLLETGKPAVGDMFIGPVAEKPLVAMAVPVIRNERIRYVLIATIETDHLKKHLDEIALPAGWFLTIRDGKGAVMAHSSAYDKDSAATADKTQQFDAKSSVSHWAVVLEIPARVYIGPVVKAAIALLAAILIAIFVSIFGGRRAGRRLSHDVKALSDYTSTSSGVSSIEEISSAQKKLLDASEALRESEEMYRAFFHNSLDAIMITSPDGRILEANPAACAMLNHTEQDICSLGRDGLVNFDDPRLGPLMDERGKHGKVFGELTMIRADGSIFPAEISSALFNDRHGNTRTVMIIRDITERKWAENELREKELQYRNLADSGLALIWTSGTDKLCNYFNKPWLKFTGRTLEQEIGNGWTEGVHPEDLDGCVQTFVNAFDKREPFDMEYRLRHASGEYRWIRDMGAPNYNSAGDFIGYIGHCFDITERRKLEAQLRHAQKLEGIGQLSGGIAHDFNNILNTVIGYAELIERHTGADDPVRQYYAKEITAAGMRGAALTRQILAFSRKQALEMKPVNINDNIDNLQKMLRRLVREDITINMNLSDKDLIVMADSDQIDQALINLTTNASDAMPAGGKIGISTARFVMDEDFIQMHGYGSPGKYALITFSDTGSGMDAETRRQIFDPFFTTKERGKGTGLGLAVVHGILKQHGGHISVYSEPGIGTTFNIYLPLSGFMEDESTSGNYVELKGGSETILIAEDEAALRQLIRTVLAHFGYKVIEAVDGEDAIQKFAQNRDVVRLVILDGIMPGKNGMEAFEAIRKLRPEIKAIFVSGYAEGIFDPDYLSGKGADFLQKPVKPDDLLRAVRETLDAAL